MVSRRRAAGHPIGAAGALIAAIAGNAAASIATRDVRGFADCGVEVVDPWAAPG